MELMNILKCFTHFNRALILALSFFVFLEVEYTLWKDNLAIRLMELLHEGMLILLILTLR